MVSGISVITICFNNLADLQRTCASVDAQILQPAAHWVINGSTNGDIAAWLDGSPQPAYRKWINERDKGISDAFNKGIDKAENSVIHLLNSGDIYASNEVLKSVAKKFEENPAIQWLTGNIQLTRAGKTVIVGKPFDKNKLYRGMRSVLHPTWFVKKEVYERIGKFKDGYRIAMDYDLMCRIAPEPYAYIDKIIVVFDDSGISSNKYIDSLKENRKVYESYFGFSYKLLIWQCRLRVLHYLLQTSFGKWLFSIKKKMGLENM